MGRLLRIICCAILAAGVLGAAQAPQGQAEKTSPAIVSEVRDTESLDRTASERGAQYQASNSTFEERDLSAQEGMAHWAQAMFWATVAALILSGFSVILIFVTFRESKRAADAADRMAEEAVNATRAAQNSAVIALQVSHAQLRPWLKLEVESSTCRWMEGDSGVTTHITVKITNTGVSPALQCGASVAVQFVSLTEKLNDQISLPNKLGAMAPIFSGDSITHGCGFQQTHDQVGSVLDAARRDGGMPCFVFDFKVSYRTPFSEEIRESALRYLITGMAGDREWLTYQGQSEDIRPRISLRVQPADILT